MAVLKGEAGSGALLLPARCQQVSAARDVLGGDWCHVAPWHGSGCGAFCCSWGVALFVCGRCSCLLLAAGSLCREKSLVKSESLNLFSSWTLVCGEKELLSLLPLSGN